MTDATSSEVPFLVVSSDGHAGAKWADYRPYVDAAHLDDFDRWLATVAPIDRLIGGTALDVRGNWIRDAVAAEPAVIEGGLLGASDPTVRARKLDRDGVAAEVIFPDGLNENGPPFEAMTSLEPREGAHVASLRLAGSRAYNRWLADFCAANPGRHAGVALIQFDDVETAVDEIRIAHRSGLFGGILLPGLPLTTNDSRWMIHHPRFEPIWDVCEELAMPLNIHSTGSGVDYGDLPGSRWIHTTEAYWASRRPVWQLLWSGVLDRHPALRVVMTEVMGAWLPFELQYWEYLYDARNPEVIRELLPLRPSQYWERQCFVGASPPAGRLEIEGRAVIGVKNLMWGSDYPHPDGAWPHSRERISEMFAGVPESEVRRMLGENAVEVFGFDAPALRAIAERIGPLPSDISSVPVSWGEPHKLAFVNGVTTIAPAL